MSGWLDALLGRLFSSGVEITLSKGLNFTSGLSATLNLSTKIVDVSVAADSLTPAKLAVESSGAAVPFVLRIPMTAGVAGTADDVTGAAAPCDLRIIDRWADITTAIGGSTVRLRDASGGLGDSLSGSISSAAQAEGVRASSGSVSSQSILDAGEVPYVRRSDRGVAGAVYLLCIRR